VLVSHNDTFYEQLIPEAKVIGINMRLLEDREQLYVSLATNEQSYAIVKDQEFSLAILKGDEMVLESSSFNKDREVNLLLKNNRSLSA
jgi:hypothetical protein